MQKRGPLWGREGIDMDGICSEQPLEMILKITHKTIDSNAQSITTDISDIAETNLQLIANSI